MIAPGNARTQDEIGGTFEIAEVIGEGDDAFVSVKDAAGLIHKWFRMTELLPASTVPAEPGTSVIAAGSAAGHSGADAERAGPAGGAVDESGAGGRRRRRRPRRGRAGARRAGCRAAVTGRGAGGAVPEPRRQASRSAGEEANVRPQPSGGVWRRSKKWRAALRRPVDPAATARPGAKMRSRRRGARRDERRARRAAAARKRRQAPDGKNR